MDERLRIGLWIVSGAGGGSLLGGAFGALTGALFAQSGRMAGTRLGRQVVEAFVRTGERELSPVAQGAVVGAADGVLFLGTLGLVGGALLGLGGREVGELLVPAALGSLLLVGAAAFFGVLAYGMTRHGMRAVLLVFVAGLLGSFVAGVLLGADRCLLGTIPGLAVGLVLSFVTRRYTPAFRPPRVREAAPRRRADARTDITGTPPPHPDTDFFRPTDSFEEE